MGGLETKKERSGSERRPFEKIMKKVLAGTEKGITFATRFRKEKDKALWPEVL